jgi:UDP-N-acetylmuramoylalanine--D-glutamate ligase
MGEPEGDDYGLIAAGGQTWLARGGERLIAADELGIRGSHNALNALAALALGAAAGLSRDGMLAALRAFTGLPHRMQAIGERRGVRWYNDSKRTNVGATLAALGGLPGRVVLIAGGLGKGQDFAPLREVAAVKARAVILIGRDAPLIEAALNDAASIHYAGDMREAVERAAALARPGDSVLLSPACASFDMFSGYEDRGRRFVAAFAGLAP